MKQYPVGFVPINFQLVGVYLLFVGAVGALIKGIYALLGLFGLPNIILAVAVACVGLGAYLILIVPKEK